MYKLTPEQYLANLEETFAAKRRKYDALKGELDHLWAKIQKLKAKQQNGQTAKDPSDSVVLELPPEETGDKRAHAASKTPELKLGQSKK